MLSQYAGDFVALVAGVTTTLIGGWVAVQQIKAKQERTSAEVQPQTIAAMNQTITTLNAALAACHSKLAECDCNHGSMTSSSNGTSTTSSESSENTASNE